MAADDYEPKVHCYTTENLKMVVNVFIVETPSGVVCIDAATALSSSREIRSFIDQKIRKPLLAILLTHGHPDHYIGAGEIIGKDDIPIVATKGTLDFAMYQDEYKIHTLQKGYGENFPKKRIFPNVIVKSGDSLTYDGISFTITDFGPAESNSDSIWETTISGRRHVFAGDLVYNKRHSYFRDGHAKNWLSVLDTMLQMYDHTTIIHPGHGETCGCEIIFWQKAYIRAFLYTLCSLLGEKETLNKEEQNELFLRMKSFLPDETIIFLMEYEPEHTIKALREQGALENFY